MSKNIRSARIGALIAGVALFIISLFPLCIGLLAKSLNYEYTQFRS